MGADAFGQQRGVTLGQLIGIAHQAQTADDFAHGVLKAGQAQSGHQRPVVWDILQVSGVGNQLAEQRPGFLDLAQLLLAGVLLGAGSYQAMSAHDALNGADAQQQDEFHFQAFGPEAGLTTQSNHHTLERGRGLVRTAVRTAGAFGQRRGFARLVASPPFAHGVARATEDPRGVLNAVLAGVAHELLVQPMPIRFHAIQFEVAGVHEPRVVPATPATSMR
jgi:hypothetical protein